MVGVTPISLTKPRIAEMGEPTAPTLSEKPGYINCLVFNSDFNTDFNRVAVTFARCGPSFVSHCIF